MRPIFITLPNSLAVRDVVNTGTLDRLANRFDGEIVVFMDHAAAEQRVEYPENVTIKTMPRSSRYTVGRVLQLSLEQRFYRLFETAITGIKRRESREFSPRRYWLNKLAALPFPRSEMLFNAIRNLERRTARGSQVVRAAFDEYDPSLLYVTNPNTLEEYEFLIQARRAGTHVTGMIRSWDVPSTKGWMPVHLDDVFVWGEYVAECVSNFEQAEVDRIHIVGAPRFDNYSSPPPNSLKADFLSAFNLDPLKPTILYASSPPRISPDEPLVVEQLSRRLPDSAQILLRLHPQDDPSRWDTSNRDNIGLQIPGTSVGDIFGGRLMSETDLSDLARALTFTDVCVSVWSTLMIEAASLDRPIVGVNFDVVPRPYLRSVERFIRSDHIQRTISTGAIAAADNIEELVAEIRNALINPGALARQRGELARMMCGPLDGKSADRVADKILEFALAERVSTPAV
jgi:hypothetical protein